MSKVALPPGIYSIQTFRVGKNGNIPYAVTIPDTNGSPFLLKNYDARNLNQQFMINGSGLIFASFNRNSLAYAQTPSLLHESVKRSTTGVAWFIAVDYIADGYWKGDILSPDENKHYWNPDDLNPDDLTEKYCSDNDIYFQTTISLRRIPHGDWNFIPVTVQETQNW